MARRVLTPAQKAAKAARAKRRRQLRGSATRKPASASQVRKRIEKKNIHMTKGEQAAIIHMERHGGTSVELYTSRGTLKTYKLSDLQKKLKKGGPKRARRGGYLSHGNKAQVKRNKKGTTVKGQRRTARKKRKR